MKKKNLKQAVGASSALSAQMGRNENVSTYSLVKICTSPNCNTVDIMEIVPNSKQDVWRKGSYSLGR